MAKKQRTLKKTHFFYRKIGLFLGVLWFSLFDLISIYGNLVGSAGFHTQDLQSLQKPKTLQGHPETNATITYSLGRDQSHQTMDLAPPCKPGFW